MTGQEIIPPNGSAVMQAPERPALTPMEIIQSAIERGAGLDTVEKLMELQERWEANQARKAFDAAMSAAKAEIPVIVKTREVDFTTDKGRTHYRYEDLATIAEAINPILSQHGLSYRFRTQSPPNEAITVTCIISHRLGHSEENSLSAPRDTTGNKNGIQSIGSALTYLQRMTLKAALGLAAAADDDGRASGPPPRQPRPEVKRETKPAMSQKTADQVAKFVAETNTALLNCESEADVEKAWAKRAQKLEDLRAIDADTAARLDLAKRKRIADFTGEVIDESV